MLIFVCYAMFMHILFFLPNAQKIAIENCSCRLYIVVYFGTIAIYLVSYCIRKIIRIKSVNILIKKKYIPLVRGDVQYNTANYKSELGEMSASPI